MGPADPDQQSAIGDAVQWLVSLATGELALVIATIAVAVVGLLMLDGRLDWRRGARVILGCFLIFGAGTISGAFMTLGSDAVQSDRSSPVGSQSNIQPENANDDPWAASYLKQDTQQPVKKP